MNFTLVFHRLALEEVQNAHDWYEQQRTGLGMEFMDAIDEVVQRIVENPNTYPKAYQQRRKALPARFDIPTEVWTNILSNLCPIILKPRVIHRLQTLHKHPAFSHLPINAEIKVNIERCLTFYTRDPDISSYF